MKANGKSFLEIVVYILLSEIEGERFLCNFVSGSSFLNVVCWICIESDYFSMAGFYCTVSSHACHAVLFAPSHALFPSFTIS